MAEQKHYIYKTTLLCGSLANHYYIGKHSTTARWDSYVGSGRIIRDYIKKYGAKKGETYVKEILEYNPDKPTNNRREEEIIGDKWKTDPLCLNLRAGGDGGQMASGKDNPRYGKHHTEETKAKMSKAAKGKPKSEKHKQFCRIAALGKTPWNKGLTYKNEKDSNSMKKKWQDPEYRKKCSESHKGQVSARRKPVISTVIETGEVEQWVSVKQAAEILGLGYWGNISSCLNGRRNKAFGRTWEYAS